MLAVRTALTGTRAAARPYSHLARPARAALCAPPRAMTGLHGILDKLTHPHGHSRPASNDGSRPTSPAPASSRKSLDSKHAPASTHSDEPVRLKCVARPPAMPKELARA